MRDHPFRINRWAPRLRRRHTALLWTLGWAMMLWSQACPAPAEEPFPTGAGFTWTSPSGGDAAALAAVYRRQPPQKEPLQKGPAQKEPSKKEPSKKEPGDEEPSDELRALEESLQRPATAAAAPALEQEVSSVSRSEGTVGKSPTAVFVITNDMIRRSGATTVAEALRMAPGLNVARVDSANWAISSRGFQQRFADKLLVQIDGRIVYNPIFSGVYWQLQDLLLQDVERIEVIRGPGATVWGANAVNGIISIITKSAKDTQGGLIVAGGGTEERGFSGGRAGGKISDNAHYRVWGKWREVDNGFNANGQAVEDWRAGRGGFRVDWEPSRCDTVTLQGDFFNHTEGLFETHPTPVPPLTFASAEDRRLSGGNVLGRWNHKIDKESDWQVQLYYDNLEVRQSIAQFDINTVDLDFQHQFPLSDCQKLIWGFGYRLQDILFGGSNFDNGFQIQPFPPGRELNLFSTFVQDQITLIDDRWYFTTGCKFEHNDFTGFEVQPTARLLFTPDERRAAWGAISRAVRTPNFAEHNLQITTLPTGAGLFPRITPSPGFESEEVIAYELGYRAQPVDDFSWDIALFFNDYRGLRITAPIGLTPPIIPLQIQNGMDGETYGVELTANFQMTDCWKLYLAYTFLQMQLHAPTLPSAEAAEDQSPQNQVYAQSSWDFGRGWEFDLIGRYVDRLSGFGTPDSPVDNYLEMDLRLGYRPNCHWEFAVVGQNLLDNHHLEFGTNPLVGRPLVEAQRGVYGMMTWTR